ncbi:hypothetical protein K2X30_14195 [bacterium]|nr:hypothetical protein [bacterium]
MNRLIFFQVLFLIFADEARAWPRRSAMEEALVRIEATQTARQAARIRRARVAQEKARASAEVALNRKGPGIFQRQGQTLFLIWVVSGVEIVRQEVHLSGLKKEQVTPEELTRLAGVAAKEIIDSGSTTNSLLFGGLAGLTAAPVLQVFDSLLGTAESRSFFVSFLKSAIASYATFVGWEAGGQLWEEARELLVNDDDYEKSRYLWSNLGKALRYQSKERSFAFQPEELRVLKLMFVNISDILIFDSELRNNWLYNTWRLRILTGEFSVFLSMIVGTTSLGTVLFPGAGTLGGLGFGILGGVLSLFVSQDFKNNVTDLFVDARKVGSGFGEANSIARIQADFHLNAPLEKLSRHIRELQNARESYASLSMEKIFRLHVRRLVFMGNIDIAERAGNLSPIPELQFEIQRLNNNMMKEFESLTSFYYRRVEILFQIGRNTNSHPIRFQLEQAAVQGNFSALVFSEMQRALLYGQYDSLATLAVRLLEQYYLEGYREI